MKASCLSYDCMPVENLDLDGEQRAAIEKIDRIYNEEKTVLQSDLMRKRIELQSVFRNPQADEAEDSGHRSGDLSASGPVPGDDDRASNQGQGSPQAGAIAEVVHLGTLFCERPGQRTMIDQVKRSFARRRYLGPCRGPGPFCSAAGGCPGVPALRPASFRYGDDGPAAAGGRASGHAQEAGLLRRRGHRKSLLRTDTVD